MKIALVICINCGIICKSIPFPDSYEAEAKETAQKIIKRFCVESHDVMLLIEDYPTCLNDPRWS